MDGNVRVDISGESPHEKALLAMHRDLLLRECEEYTEEPVRLSNISALETAVNALGMKDTVRDEDRRVEEDNFHKVKGRVLKKINNELKEAAETRYEIAKSSFDLGLGAGDDDGA